jgi:hypothetical protein
MMQENNSTHWILGGALLLIGLFVIIALVLTRQQAANVTLDINNVAPTVSNVKICTNPSTSSCTAVATLTTNVNADKMYDIYAAVDDGNGTADVPDNKIFGTLYRTGIGIAACDAGGEADGNQCSPLYAATSAGVANWSESTTCTGSATTKCIKVTAIPLKYWADPTSATADDFSGDNWSIRVNVEDTALATGYAETTKELEETTALSAPSTIDYGSGASARVNGFASGTSTNVDFGFQQQGNTDADAQIKADQASLTCSVLGAIPASAQKWESAFGANDVAYASMSYTLTTNFQDLNVMDNAGNSATAIRRRVSEVAAPTGNASFGIAVPYGVVGTCSGSSSINAIKQSITGAGG